MLHATESAAKIIPMLPQYNIVDVYPIPVLLPIVCSLVVWILQFVGPRGLVISLRALLFQVMIRCAFNTVVMQ
jgi:hypothetical protein